MAKARKQQGVLFIRNIPSNVKAQYKAYCAKRDISMTEDLVAYMRKCVRSIL